MNQHEESELVNFGRRYSALRMVKSVIFNKIFYPIFRARAAANHPQFVVFSSDLIGQGINLYGYWEHEELTALSHWLKANNLTGGAMLDVGANIGNHGVFLSEHYDTVHAVEPNPKTFAVLSLNAALVPNIQCHQIAASDSNGSVSFRQERTNVGHSRIVDGTSGQATTEVDCWKLDDYFPDVDNVRLVKIDVEGHEMSAIGGMQKILERCSPVVIFEQHLGGFVNGISPVIELLKKNGYTDFYSVDRIPSTQRGGRVGKLWFFLCSMLLGFRLVVRHRTTVEPAFYEMLIARKGVAA